MYHTLPKVRKQTIITVIYIVEHLILLVEQPLFLWEGFPQGFGTGLNLNISHGSISEIREALMLSGKSLTCSLHFQFKAEELGGVDIWGLCRPAMAFHTKLEKFYDLNVKCLSLSWTFVCFG